MKKGIAEAWIHELTKIESKKQPLNGEAERLYYLVFEFSPNVKREYLLL